eukprot:scaffold194_cov277-Pinguiococcus_pyrenoidosus.AAC.2
MNARTCLEFSCPRRSRSSAIPSQNAEQRRRARQLLELQWKTGRERCTIWSSIFGAGEHPCARVERHRFDIALHVGVPGHHVQPGDEVQEAVYILVCDHAQLVDVDAVGKVRRLLLLFAHDLPSISVVLGWNQHSTVELTSILACLAAHFSSSNPEVLHSPLTMLALVLVGQLPGKGLQELLQQAQRLLEAGFTFAEQATFQQRGLAALLAVPPSRSQQRSEGSGRHNWQHAPEEAGHIHRHSDVEDAAGLVGIVSVAEVVEEQHRIALDGQDDVVPGILGVATANVQVVEEEVSELFAGAATVRVAFEGLRRIGEEQRIVLLVAEV